MQNKLTRRRRFTGLAFLGAFALGLAALSPLRAWAQQTVCAVVKLELGQQAALEREAFKANLGLTNNLGDLPLSQLRIDVLITDPSGSPANSLFFIKTTNLQNVNAVDGTGTVQPAGSAAAEWLIIPSTGAGGSGTTGVKYNVTARMSFYTGGVPRITTTFPVAITVKPQPVLFLEYALPFEVFGPQPLLPAVSIATEPFALGLRVVNVGSGTANNFSVNSAQPQIVDNAQGLAVNFNLLGSYLGSTALTSNSLNITYGDVPAGGSKQAAWIMASSFAGRFTDFTANFTHAAALGGALTSLIQGVSTYTLIKDVQDDTPGRDAQFDFMINRTTPRTQLEQTYATGDDPLPTPEFIMESDQTGMTPVLDVPGVSSNALSGSNAVLGFAFAVPVPTGTWVHAAIPVSFGGSVQVLSAIRSDGKSLNPHNFWISKHFNKLTLAFSYKLHVLDFTAAQGAQTYALTFGASALDAPPDPITSLSVSTAGPGALALNWTSTGEDASSGTIVGGRYAIYASTDLSAMPSVAASSVSFSTSTPAQAAQGYALSGLLGNATYQVAVFLADAHGNYSNGAGAARMVTLAVPPTVTASNVTTSGFALSWSTAVNAAGAQYRMQLSTGGGAVSDTGYAADASSAAFATLSANQSYLVTALMETSAGVPTPPVAVATATTLAAPPVAAASSFIAVSSAGLTVQWQYGADPADTEFLAELSTSPDHVPAAYAGGWARSASFAFAGLTAQTSYYARVKARSRAAVETAYTELGTARTSAFSILPQTGAAGAAFSLAGANFGPFAGAATRVRFGAELATVAAWSGARITGFVPADLVPGAYAVQVERQNGAAVTPLNGGTFTVLPASPSTGTVVTLSPADGDLVTLSTPTISASYAAALGVDTTSVHLTLDGAPVAASIGASAATFVPVAALSEGTHTVTAGVADLSANAAAATATFLVDTIAPTTALAVDGLTASATTLTVISTQALSLAATDAGSGVADTVYLLDVDPNTCDFSAFDANAAPGTCANPYYGGPFSLSTGAHTLAFYSDDAAGNSEDYTHVALSVRSPLYTAVSADGLATLVSGVSNETIAAVAASTAAAAASAAQNLAAATSSYDLSPSDALFNPPATIRFAFNPGAASTTDLHIFAFNGVSWDSAAITGQNITSLSSSAVLLSGTLTRVSLYGVFFTSSSDVIAPVTTIAFSTPSLVSSGTVVAITTRSSVTLTSVDPSSGTGVAATYYGIDASTPATVYTGPFTLPSGTHTVYYRSVDAAGNAEAVSETTVAVYDGPFAGAVVPSSGPIGVSISLTGFNFGAYGGANSQLLFGASTSPVSVWNDAAITASVPGVSTGTYTLTVVSLRNGAMSAVSVGTFTVLAPMILTVVPSSGAIGLAFTLTGQAFGAYNGANTQVLLGGATVPISVWNDTRIVGTVPGVLSPGSYPVQVQRKASGGGVVLSNAVNFDVLALGLASVTPSTGPIGISFSLAGSGFGTYAGGNTQVLIGGTAAAVSVWNDTNIQGLIPALSTGAYPVTVERLQGTGVALSNVATFTVTALTLAAPVPSSGPIGVTFTLSGAGFGAYNGAGTRLLMGGATVAVSVWNDATITGAVPSLSTGAQPVWLERLSGAGLQASNTVYFQIVAPAIASVFPSSGPIGTLFTLTGSGFGAYNGANTQLLLAGTTAPITVWNDTTITATVPGTFSTGSVSVVVERIGTDGLVSLSTPSAFLVVAPNAAGIAPSTGPIGVAFTILGSGFGAFNGANTVLLIGGTTAAVSVWNDAAITGTVPALSTGDYSVVVERVQGPGTSLTTVATFTVTALVLSTPTPSGGPVGTSFTLAGSGFGAYNGTETRLLIGGSTAAVSVWNDSTITGVAPTLAVGPQPVWIERLSGAGLESSNTVYFLVVAPAIASVVPSSGPIGVTFTLTGSGFGVYAGENTRVLIGGTTTAVSVWNDTTITGTVPGALAPGSVSVVVERIGTGGISFSSAAVFLVLAPGIASVSPSSAPIGSVFTLTGSGFGTYNGANTQVLIGGATTAISVWNDAKIQGTVPALSSGAYDLVVERLQGGYASFSSTVGFTVTAPQIAAMTPSSAPIGAPFTITGTSFGAYAGVNTRVLINGVIAPVSVWNDATISGTVPGAVSTGTAVVVVERTTGAGLAQSAAQAFEVLIPLISTVSPSFGPAGTVVTLTGSGFGPYAGTATTLLVGGSTVSVSVWNDSTIRWTVSASFSNGNYTLVARRAPSGGTMDSAPAAFTVGTGYGAASLGFAAVTSLAALPDTHFEGDLNLPVAEGGRVETPSKAAVTVPPNALDADTEITLKRLHKDGLRTEAADAAKVRAAGEAIEFGPEGTRFNTPVTIELPYDPALTADETQLAVHYYDPLRRVWEALPSVVDRDRRVVKAQTAHFSIYQPMGLAPATAAQDAFYFRDQYAFPNPSRGNASVTFRIQPGLADTIELRVYDLSGRKIHDSTDFTFKGAIDDGNGKGTQNTYDHVWSVSGVGGGVYTYVIKAGRAGQSPIVKTGKAGVIK